MAKHKHTHYDAAEARILRNDSIISSVMATEGSRFDSAELLFSLPVNWTM